MKPATGVPASRARMRVFIVDDHPIVRHGISVLINQQKDLGICGEAEDGREALRKILHLHPDVVIVDMTLRKADGLDLIKTLRVMAPQVPVLVLSIHDERLYADRALRAGAKGYLMKQEATEKVLTALRTVLGGKRYLSDRMEARLRRTGRSSRGNGGVGRRKLTDRELQILRLLGQGNGTRQIAAELHVSPSTVHTHRAKLKEKLALTNALELVQYATRWLEREGSR